MGVLVVAVDLVAGYVAHDVVHMRVTVGGIAVQSGVEAQQVVLGKLVASVQAAKLGHAVAAVVAGVCEQMVDGFGEYFTFAMLGGTHMLVCAYAIVGR